MSTEWTSERIAELRRRARECIAVEERYIALGDPEDLAVCEDMHDELSMFTGAASVLSLLDALEEARQDAEIARAQRDSLQAALDALQLRLDICRDALAAETRDPHVY